jgi:3-methyladenine DNA glycosylase/8-oxoguanine DNA glycosylase
MLLLTVHGPLSLVQPCPLFIHTKSDLETALKELIAADPRLVPVFERAGQPPLRRRAGGFAGLASIIVAQQLSTASAGAIWGRLNAAFDPLHPGAVRRARTARLQRIGLSAAKIKTLKAIASAIDKGTIDLDGLAEKPADEAHAALTALHGVGPWTADIYLLFCIGHADAWPAAISPCKKPCGTRWDCGCGQQAKRWVRWPRVGARGAGWRRACYGPIIAPSKGAMPRQSNRTHVDCVSGGSLCSFSGRARGASRKCLEARVNGRT